MWQIHIKCENGIVAGLIFYNDQRVAGYPLIISLANITCENRPLPIRYFLLVVLLVLVINAGTLCSSIFKSILYHILFSYSLSCYFSYYFSCYLNQSIIDVYFSVLCVEKGQYEKYEKKLQILHKCLSIILEPFKSVSFE